MQKLHLLFTLFTVALAAPAWLQAQATSQIFGGAKVEEIFRMVLDRDALVLESIQQAIRDKNIQEGHVTVTAGSVQQCTFHYVASTATKPKDIFKTVTGPYEILNMGGIIANGEPHIHMTIARQGRAAIGGHLEKGCKILYLGEVTMVKYAASPLARKPNGNGVGILGEK